MAVELIGLTGAQAPLQGLIAPRDQPFALLYHLTDVLIEQVRLQDYATGGKALPPPLPAGQAIPQHE